MAASRKPKLSKPRFGGGEAAPKGSFAMFGCLRQPFRIRELLRRGLKTSEKLVYLPCVNRGLASR